MTLFCFVYFLSGALSDINSLLNDGIPVGDFDMADDTSLSSRASSRFFDSEPILNLDSFANSSTAGIGSSMSWYLPNELVIVLLKLLYLVFR